ncbi:MAG: NADH-quinone oxidoreductase subunit I [Candidatus Zixiibacteriota bacterium]
MLSLLKGLKELIAGLGITGKHLGKHAVTLQYPEEKWPMPERSRGIVVLLSDKETGELNCTACMLCMRACPTAAIFIDAPRGEDKKRQLKVFNVDLGICCFCGLCEEACNFSAIKLAPKYEFSTENKDDLMWDMNRLQEVGRDVAYEAKPKKKPAPKPENQPAAAAANPGAEKAAEQKPEQGGSDDKKEGEA